VIGYLSLLEFFLWGSRKGTKPQRGLDLCACLPQAGLPFFAACPAALRGDILLFFFTQRRKGVLIFATSLLCERKEERAEKQEARTKRKKSR